MDAQKIAQNGDVLIAELVQQFLFAMEPMLETALRQMKLLKRDVEDQEKWLLQEIQIIKKTKLVHQFQLLLCKLVLVYQTVHGLELHIGVLVLQLPFAMDLMMDIVLKLMKLSNID